MICSTFCTSGFFAAATFVVVFCETDGAALTPGVVTGLIVAPAAGVDVEAGVVAAGVVAGGVVAAGVVLAAVAFVFGVEATLALGEALAFAFEFLLLCRFFVTSGVAVAAGVFSVLAFGATADGFFRFDFLSVFGVIAGVVPGVVAGSSVAVDSFTAEVLVFGALVTGFSACGFFSGGPCLLEGACDASGVGS